jgi:hypothetical protein
VAATFATFLITLASASPAPTPRSVAGFTTQQGAGKPAISVVVQDMTGAVIPGVDVSFRDEKTQEKMSFKTDDAGILKPTILANGRYELTFEALGFCTKKIAHVTVPREEVLRVTLDVCSVVEDGSGWLRPEAPTIQPEAVPVDSKLTVPATGAQAEAARPSISIIVVDEAGAVLPGADVTFRNEKTKEKTSAKTGADGSVKIGSLATGRYELTFWVAGFQPQKLKHVKIPSEKVLTITLLVGTVTRIDEMGRAHQ